jgi:hypothetical protein
MERGSIPQPDAVSPEEGGRPKFLWLKHNAAVVAHKLKTAKPKKGIAALV